MGWLLLAGALIAAFIIRGIYKGVVARVSAHGIHALIWRWLTGHPWHGQALTDAGWLRPGRKALTRTGHASRFHHRPRWQRAFMRTGATLLAIVLAWSWLVNRQVTQWIIAGGVALLAACGGWWAWRAWHGRKHRKTWVEPLHAALAPELGIPLANPPRSWIRELPEDRSKAVFELPPGRHWSDAKEQERIARAAMAKLGMPSADYEFRLAGPKPVLQLTRPEPVPAVVTLADVLPAVMAAGPDELVLGLGRNSKPVKVSLHGDSPHIGLSMGSGAGKSTLAAFIIAQLLFKGWTGLMLDNKLISHPWARGLPNVAYAGSVAEVHDAMCWLGGELDRRKEVALASVDMTGVIHASIGPRMLVTAEEMNMTMDELRVYWTEELGGRGRSPAIRAMRKGLFAGRGVDQHWLVIGQMLDASSSGGGAARENVGVRVLSRYTQNAWKMLCPQVPFPGLTEGVGRIRVVAGQRCEEAQAPKIDLADRADVLELRQLATSGAVAALPHDMPDAPLPHRMRGETGLREISPASGDQEKGAGETVSGPLPVSGRKPVTLSAAVAEGILPMGLAAARTARHRDERFPQPVARHGLAHLYDPVQLADWHAGRETVSS